MTQAAHDHYITQVEEEVRQKREKELEGTSQEGDKAVIEASVKAAKERVQQRLRLVVNGISSVLQWDSSYQRSAEEEEAWTKT